MSVFSVYDTETTCFKGEMVEIASLDLDETGIPISNTIEHLIKPESHTISFEAMATHHITDEMLEDEPSWKEISHLYKLESSEDNYFIAHNAKFDLGMIGRDIIGDVKVLCTLKLAKELFDKYRFGSHKLSTLWYGYGLNKRESVYKGVPHRAGYDCNMTAQVLECMLAENNLTIPEAWKLTQDKLVEDTICTMKKYRDKKLTWKEVKQQDPDYCDWLVGNYNRWVDFPEVKEYLIKS